MRKFAASFVLKVLGGILLLWLGAALACVAVQALGRIPWFGKETVVFVLCFLSYFILHFAFYRPILSHVMAHELTHALASVLMGGKVTAINASTTGGTTVTNKNHLFISLAPYVFPFYTALTLLLYAIAAPSFKIYLLGLIGFTYAFHLALTVYSLSHPQPDLKTGGTAFSLIFIFAGNMIVLLMLIAFVWPQVISLWQVVTETSGWAWRMAHWFFRFFQPHPLPPEGPRA